MGRRKNRKICRNASLSWTDTVQKGPNITGDTGESSSAAAHKESQTGPTRSSTPPPRESSPKSKLASPPSSPVSLPSASNLGTLASTAASGKLQFPAKAASSNSVAPAPHDSKETKEKPKENSDSPLPLICITRFLKGIDHCPHFLQLREYSGIVRRQLESAWDQAFIETANQIQDLKSKDIWVNGIELWKATADLETMGYNLIPLRRRLLEVRDAVLKSDRAKRKILALKEKAAEHRRAMDSLQKDIKNFELLHDELGIKRIIAQMEAERMKKKELPKCKGLMSDLAKKSFGPGDYVDRWWI